MKYEIPINLKEGLTVDEAAALTGLPVLLLRAEAYFARKKPKLSNFPALWNGNKLLIPRQPLINWLAQQGSRHTKFNLAESRLIIKDLGGCTKV